ncbi:MAG: sigma-70 family RNA polymerase sigma factor [Caldilineaceae bacterium]|nr:sigma-70 family RNA polymerase sigma factor [Caldilineaceae bacterium]
MNLAGQSDERLLQLVVQQNADAIELLYDRHSQTVFGLIVRILRDQTVAEEVLQETFWQVWEQASSYRGSGAVAAWLCRIARNKALDRLRKIKRRPETVAVDMPSHELWDMAVSTAQISSVEQSAEQNWRAQQVRSALLALPEEQRLCVELAYFDGLSHSQIAELNNLPLGTVKTRLRLGMEKLERLLASSGMQQGKASL